MPNLHTKVFKVASGVADFLWTCPAGVTVIELDGWGAGGNGGNSCIPGSTATGQSPGCSGGAGGSARRVRRRVAVTPGVTYAIHIGNNTAQPVNTDVALTAKKGLNGDNTTFSVQGGAVLATFAGAGGGEACAIPGGSYGLGLYNVPATLLGGQSVSIPGRENYLVTGDAGSGGAGVYVQSGISKLTIGAPGEGGNGANYAPGGAAGARAPSGSPSPEGFAGGLGGLSGSSANGYVGSAGGGGGAAGPGGKGGDGGNGGSGSAGIFSALAATGLLAGGGTGGDAPADSGAGGGGAGGIAGCDQTLNYTNAWPGGRGGSGQLALAWTA